MVIKTRSKSAKMREPSATPYPMPSIEAGMEINGASFPQSRQSGPCSTGAYISPLNLSSDFCFGVGLGEDILQL